jgi:hypothetical protein
VGILGGKMFGNTLVIETPGMAMSLFLGMLELETLSGRQGFHFINGQGKNYLGLPNILVKGCSIENFLAVIRCFNPTLFVVKTFSDH